MRWPGARDQLAWHPTEVEASEALAEIAGQCTAEVAELRAALLDQHRQ